MHDSTTNSIKPPAKTDAALPDDTQRLIYTLGIHQVELEMQHAELLATKAQIETLANKYVELYDFSPAGYFTLSREGTIIESNLYGSQLLGKERIYLNNTRFDLFVTPEYLPEFNTFIERVFNCNAKTSCEIELMTEKGNLPVFLLLSGIAIEEKSKCLIAAIDISERKRVEEELRLKNRELQVIIAEKDKFFSIIAHDLRSPFNGFLGLTELMAEKLTEMTLEETINIVGMMKNSATNLNHLLGNLLEWSRMQRGLVSFNPMSYNLRKIMDESLVVVLEAAKAKNISIDFEISEDLGIFADQNMLQSILRNLVSNAVKFTPRGGRITLSASANSKSEVVFSIKDTGIGMNKTIIGNLFRLDVQTGRKGTDGELTTGLGLMICKDFIEKHNGKLWVESEVGEGSNFHFALPMYLR